MEMGIGVGMGTRLSVNINIRIRISIRFSVITNTMDHGEGMRTGCCRRRTRRRHGLAAVTVVLVKSKPMSMLTLMDTAMASDMPVVMLVGNLMARYVPIQIQNYPSSN